VRYIDSYECYEENEPIDILKQRPLALQASARLKQVLLKKVANDFKVASGSLFEER